MSKLLHSDQKGAITLLMVFSTAVIMFLFAFADHTIAFKEKMSAQNDAQTEKAFYAAQGCIEEGYLKLREDANYPGTEIAVGQSTCTVVPEHEIGATSGELFSEGTYQNKIRTIDSHYSNAGASESRNNTVIYHILDRSSSMANASYCTIPEYIDKNECLAHYGEWVVEPFTSSKNAAKSFVDHLNPDFDQIGIVSYNDTTILDIIAGNDFTAAKQAIDNIGQPLRRTNIGDALALATSNLDPIEIEYSKVEILLTDGVANRPEPEEDAEEYALGKASEAEEKGIIIFTIGLGPGVNEDFLIELASEIDGSPLYFYAPDDSDLEGIYEQIANIIITYDISQNSWFEK